MKLEEVLRRRELSAGAARAREQEELLVWAQLLKDVEGKEIPVFLKPGESPEGERGRMRDRDRRTLREDLSRYLKFRQQRVPEIVASFNYHLSEIECSCGTRMFRSKNMNFDSHGTRTQGRGSASRGASRGARSSAGQQGTGRRSRASLARVEVGVMKLSQLVRRAREIAGEPVALEPPLQPEGYLMSRWLDFIAREVAGVVRKRRRSRPGLKLDR